MEMTFRFIKQRQYTKLSDFYTFPDRKPLASINAETMSTISLKDFYGSNNLLINGCITKSGKLTLLLNLLIRLCVRGCVCGSGGVCKCVSLSVCARV